MPTAKNKLSDAEQGMAVESVTVDARYDLDPSLTLLGRKVKTVDTDDAGKQHSYVGTVTDYNPLTQEHCITYDVGTKKEIFEWMSATRSKDVVEILPDEAVDVGALPEPPSA